MADDVVYPQGFPVGEGGLSRTRAGFMIVTPTLQAAADELRNYGKRLDDFDLLFVVETEADAAMTHFVMPEGSVWCVAGDPLPGLRETMEGLHGPAVTVAKAVALVNDQYAIHPKALMGVPKK